MTRLEEILNILELGLRINAPDNVRTAWFDMDFREKVLEEGEMWHVGYIKFHVMTNTKALVANYCKVWALDDSEETQCNFLQSLIDEEDYIKVWNRIKFYEE
ncbi:MAG: hypothetical protein IKQ03_05490 [Prevotella sp.]|nr:hypothetical protein [Prevotella sp.]